MSLLQLDNELPATREGNSIEGSLKSLWDKVHSVVELVSILKSENASLQERYEQNTAEFMRMKAQFESQLADVQNRYERETSEMKARNEESIASLKSYYENELVALRSAAEEQLLATQTQLESALSETKSRLESELHTTRNQLSVKEQDLKRLRAEYSQIVSANDNLAFTKEEKEILRNRIRELIAKINSHL